MLRQLSFFNADLSLWKFVNKRARKNAAHSLLIHECVIICASKFQATCLASRGVFQEFVFQVDFNAAALKEYRKTILCRPDFFHADIHLPILWNSAHHLHTLDVERKLELSVLVQLSIIIYTSFWISFKYKIGKKM